MVLDDCDDEADQGVTGLNTSAVMREQELTGATTKTQQDMTPTEIAAERAKTDFEPFVAARRPPTKPFDSIRNAVHNKLFTALTQNPFNYTHMSPVQEAVLELLPGIADPVGSTPDPNAPFAPGSDMLVKAKTGTGKTLAFLVPAVEGRIRDIKLEEARFKRDNPAANRDDLARHLQTYRRTRSGIVILSPTRELATQIANEAVRLCSHMTDMEVRLFVGGSSKGQQLRDWNRGMRDIVVATPGRMYDLLTTARDVASCISQAKTLILDEADTLLEMGFKDEIDRIVSFLPPKERRQTFLFSATVSRDIQGIARRTMKPDPQFIDCVPEGETNTHEHIPQYYTVVPSADMQIPHILNLIAHDQLLHPDGGKAIIFLPTTRLTQMMSKVLMRIKSSLPWGTATGVHEIHGGRKQEERTAAATAFRSATTGYQILVTSDVSARGPYSVAREIRSQT